MSLGAIDCLRVLARPILRDEQRGSLLCLVSDVFENDDPLELLPPALRPFARRIPGSRSGVHVPAGALAAYGLDEPFPEYLAPVERDA